MASTEVLREMLHSKDDSSIQYAMIPVQTNNVHARAKPSQFIRSSSEGNYLTLCAALNHPFSRGSVHITTSAHPTEKPRIDPKYLSHHLDNEILARRVQYMEKLVVTELPASLLKKGGRRIPVRKHVEELDAAEKSGPRDSHEHTPSNGDVRHNVSRAERGG
ncbi:MAG: hypothetical protein L6R35_007380 [Caloplaca aegaea]|nr:MAG: hypothetical protein L6R35_007380 [Caloplaca aegaea]